MKLLNIACGSRYHKDWINIDFHPHSKNVMRVNILKGLPFEDNSMDVVYCSHFLEHLSQEQAKFVLTEMKRVLKFKGILRIVVPDLENICREYLKIIDSINSSGNNKTLDKKYRWIILELLDQLVRVTVGDDKVLFQNY